MSTIAYKTDSITVDYTVPRCIHAAECVRGLPQVFDPSRRPWIDPSQATADEVAEVVMRCPTGALHFTRTDGGAAEPLPESNTVRITANGPIYVRGDISILTPDGQVVLNDTRVALCRCGDSHNKPFCDNSHLALAFMDEGIREALSTEDVPPLERSPLTITVLDRGPLLLKGSMTIMGADGTEIFRGDKRSLCRCGGSQNKPFCDGSHKQNGFTGE